MKLKEIPSRGAIRINNINSSKIPNVINYLTANGREKVYDTRDAPWAYFTWNESSMRWCKASTGMKIYDLKSIIDYIKSKSKELTKADLIDNEIYYHDQYIIRYDIDNHDYDDEIAYKTGFINGPDKWDKSDGWNDFKVGEVRKATSKERQWFLECEYADKFVPLDEVSDILSHDDLELGNYYHCKWEDGSITKSVAIVYLDEEIKYNSTHSNKILFYKQKKWNNDNGLTSDRVNFRLATRGEIEWYDKCAMVDRFIDKDEIINNCKTSWSKEDFINTRIHLRNSEQSERFQKLIFKFGFKWYDGKTISYVNDEFIYIYNSLIKIKRNSDINWFKKHENKEIFYNDIFCGTNIEGIVLKESLTLKRPIKIKTLENDFQKDRIYVYSTPKQEEVIKTKSKKIILKTIKQIKL